MFWSVDSDLYLIEKISPSLGMLRVGYNPIKSCKSNTVHWETKHRSLRLVSTLSREATLPFHFSFSSQLGSTLKGKEFPSLKASSFPVKSTGVVPIVEGFYYQGKQAGSHKKCLARKKWQVFPYLK